MATFYDRVLMINDYETDGGPIDTGHMHSMLFLFEAGLVTETQVKAELGLTTAGQIADVDALLATMPANPNSVPNAVARARWVNRIYHVLKLGVQQLRFTTEAECKAALEIA